MKKYFLLYAPESAVAAEKARALAEAVTAGGGSYSDLSAAEVKAQLLAADYLLCIAAQQKEFDAKSFDESWRYFDNELNWKRKTSGEIVLILNGGFDDYRLPFKLRDCQLYSFDAPIAEILGEAETVEREEIISTETAEALTDWRAEYPKEIDRKQLALPDSEDDTEDILDEDSADDLSPQQSDLFGFDRYNNTPKPMQNTKRTIIICAAIVFVIVAVIAGFLLPSAVRDRRNLDETDDFSELPTQGYRIDQDGGAGADHVLARGSYGSCMNDGFDFSIVFHIRRSLQ